MFELLKFLKKRLFGQDALEIFIEKYNYTIYETLPKNYELMSIYEEFIIKNGGVIVKNVEEDINFIKKDRNACNYDIIRWNRFLKNQKRLYLEELKRISDEKMEYIFRGSKALKIAFSIITKYVNEFKKTFKIKLFIRRLIRNKNSTQSLRLLYVIYTIYDIKRYYFMKKNNNKRISNLYSILIILRTINLLIEIKYLGTAKVQPIKNSFISFGLFELIYQILFFIK
uniref:Uncharacterized protein n=1 Tax=Nitzschia sp. IriIs04 TaxID=1444690 RepID=A0A0S3QPJ0_9STRA|nr:hypothetical protein [Nitzschia sp. IriIs04]YP_009193355.1 hypothetical protein [Nitzschia sp. IriIs04]BAT70250.1 hypothetical protein [Nitzschia sp. IriIs04]BAT70280.1 hypothetical protein [Nitzschia sp. IriIs04]